MNNNMNSLPTEMLLCDDASNGNSVEDELSRLWSQYPKGIIGQLKRINRSTDVVVAVDVMSDLLMSFEKKGKIRVWDKKMATCLTTLTSCNFEIQSGHVLHDAVIACGDHLIQSWNISSLSGRQWSSPPPQNEWTTDNTIVASCKLATTNEILVATSNLELTILSNTLTPLSTCFITATDRNADYPITSLHSCDDFIFAAQGSSQPGGSVVHVLKKSDSGSLTAVVVVNGDDFAINGKVNSIDDYEGHTLVVAADENVSLWTISDKHPLLKKSWARLHGISKPHQGSCCTSLRVWRGFGVSAAEDGTLKLWNFEQNQGALPAVVRVLPGQEEAIRCIAVTDTSFFIGGEEGIVCEWDESRIPNKILSQHLPKSLGGHSLPVSGHLIPSRMFGPIDLQLLVTTVVTAIVSFQQFLSLPFANEEMWAKNADPMTVVLPVFNLKFSLSEAAYESAYWLSVALTLLMAVLFIANTVPKLMMKAAQLHSSAKGNWPQLLSNDPEVVKDTQDAIDRLKKRAKKTSLFVTIFHRYIWLVCGMGLMPLMGKLVEVYSCTEITVNGQVVDRWALNTEITCYTTYHKVKMIVSACSCLLLLLISCRLSFLGNDVRLLCRTSFDSGGNPVTGVTQLFSSPISQRSWPLLPLYLLPTSSFTSYEFIMFLLRAIGGILSAFSVNQGFSTGRIQSWCVAFTLLVLMAVPVFVAPYHSGDLMRNLFAFNAVSAFAGCCGVFAVITTIKAIENGNDPSSVPAVVWYAGAVPVFLAAYFVYPKIRVDRTHE
eukprot:TRINITY_DN8889_c1_g1_i1.p1 TRINITY_DN8889_c1_g1~~TRINITY_DN8889_c1_g1_i1.p1  ORF type:complete len:774 (+),score=126.36 TRINITY_DN8889_c1_g1_i1:47-2368(+)